MSTASMHLGSPLNWPHPVDICANLGWIHHRSRPCRLLTRLYARNGIASLDSPCEFYVFQFLQSFQFPRKFPVPAGRRPENPVTSKFWSSVCPIDWQFSVKVKKMFWNVRCCSECRQSQSSRSAQGQRIAVSHWKIPSLLAQSRVLPKVPNLRNDALLQLNLSCRNSIVSVVE